MTRKTLFLFVLLIGCFTAFAQNDSPKSNCVNIELPTGKLSLQPLNQNTVRVRSVSYTHLDVYKRQAWRHVK